MDLEALQHLVASELTSFNGYRITPHTLEMLREELIRAYGFESSDNYTINLRVDEVDRTRIIVDITWMLPPNEININICIPP